MSIKLNSFISSSSSCYNFLILGESGTGKSTTINALANQLLFSFDEALKFDSKFKTVIPTKFALSSPVSQSDSDPKPFIVSTHKDELTMCHQNEKDNDDGESCTQKPMGHIFTSKDSNGNPIMIRIIDTPGIGDTRGIKTDEENFENILNFLSKHNLLHGIVIMIRANENRKSVTFKYCITELLTHLHRDACRNIVFCFTFSRDSYYRRGAGFRIIQSLIEDDLKLASVLSLNDGHNSKSSDVETPINCFFIDNEGYRLLLAKQNSYQLTQKQLDICRNSWDKSSAQIQALVKHVTSLTPHRLVLTTKLNNARRLMSHIAEPLVRLRSNLETNIQLVQKKESQLRAATASSNATIEEIEMFENVTVNLVRLERIELDYPTTVCTQCVEVIDGETDAEVYYNTRCHEHCELRGVTVNLVADPILRNCWAMMNGASQYCERECKCPWDKHMHIRCEYRKVIEPTSITKRLKQKKQRDSHDNNNKTEIDKSILENMKSFVEELKLEVNIIENANKNFAQILNANSNVVSN